MTTSLICQTYLPDLFHRVTITFNINNSIPPNLEEEPEQAEDNEVEPALTFIHIYGSKQIPPKFSLHLKHIWRQFLANCEEMCRVNEAEQW